MFKIGYGVFEILFGSKLIKKKVYYEIYFLVGAGILTNCNLKFLEAITEDEQKCFGITEESEEFDFADFLETMDFLEDDPVWSITDDKGKVVFSS